MTTKTISLAQAVIVLTISQLFSTVLFSPILVPTSDSSMLLYGSLLSFLLQAIFLIPMWMYFRTGEQDLFAHCRQRGGVFLWFAVLMLLLLLGGLWQTAVRFQFFITTAVFSEASTVVVLVTFMIATVYGASMGLEGLVRAASIIGFFSLALLLLTDATLLSEIDPINLRPITQDSTFSILQIAFDQASTNSTLLLLVLLRPYIKGSFHKLAGYYLLLSGVLTALLVLFCVLVLGDYLQVQSFPYYSMASVASTSVFQRLDALQMSMIVLMSFVKMTLFLLFVVKLLQKMLPTHWRTGSFWGGVGVVLLGSLGLSWYVSRYPIANQMAGTDLLLFLVLVILPMLLLWKGGNHEKNTVPAPKH